MLDALNKAFEQLKLSTLNGEANQTSQAHQETRAENLEDELSEKINELNRQKNELKLEKDNLKANYAQYVENLVDQINQMTDEREKSYEIIQSLEKKIIGKKA